MKIAISSTGQGLDDAVDPRFGRCAWFALYDTATGVLEAIANPLIDAAGGAGTQAAQWILGQGAAVLVTGHCGPKAAAVLADAGIRVIEGARGSVREALVSVTAESPTVGNGTGLGRGQGGPGFGGGRGPGFGGGAGASPGQGHGMGRGLGRGHRRGPGGGAGQMGQD
jgi:predicted Fe-Mo cluster-binding NifX family protein